MRWSYKIFVYFFNFIGVLCLKTRDNDLAVSQILLIFNLILHPFMALICYCISASVFINSVKTVIYDTWGSSKFLLFSLTSMSIMYIIVTFCVVYIQLWKRKIILILIQNCVKAYKFAQIAVDEEIKKEFERNCWTTLGISWLLGVVWNFRNFITLMKFNLTSFLLFEVFNYNVSFVIHLIAFVSLFFNFFVILLKSFRSKLKCSDRNSESYEKLIIEYSNFLKLVTEFNKVFGLVLSLSITLIMFYTTLRVRVLNGSVNQTFKF